MFAYKVVPLTNEFIGYQEYLPGVVYTYNGPIKINEWGFNAVSSLHTYKDISVDKRFFEVKLLGAIYVNSNGTLITDKIEIIKEVVPSVDPCNYNWITDSQQILVDRFQSSVIFDNQYNGTVIGSDGSSYRYKDGVLHDGYYSKPAIVNSKGDSIWMQYGEIHRDGLPAYMSHTQCTQLWYKHNKLHRENDLPAAEYPDDREWWIDGKRHRDGDKPAVVNGRSGDCLEWWVDDKRHRAGGQPAVLWKNGPEEYWENGVQYTKVMNRTKKRSAYVLNQPESKRQKL